MEQKHAIEIEVKSLLGERAVAEALKKKLRDYDADMRLVGTSKQLNHYFVGGTKELLEKNFSELLSDEKRKLFVRILNEGRDVSIRTRQADEAVLLVLKASVDDTTSQNGTARIEFEAELPLTLDALDAMLLDAGCTYQAKWSRDREEYALSDGTTVCIDRNAGYGYLAEFERVVAEGESVEAVKAEIRSLMDRLGVEELPQDRLERMFAHYNEHWNEYYGTDHTFVIE